MYSFLGKSELKFFKEIPTKFFVVQKSILAFVENICFYPENARFDLVSNTLHSDFKCVKSCTERCATRFEMCAI